MRSLDLEKEDEGTGYFSSNNLSNPQNRSNHPFISTQPESQANLLLDCLIIEPLRGLATRPTTCSASGLSRFTTFALYLNGRIKISHPVIPLKIDA